MTLIDQETNLLMDPAKRDFSFKRMISVFAGLAIFLASIWYYIVYPTDKKLDSQSKYTIGTVTKIESVLDGDPVASFIYNVDNKNYSGRVTIFRDERISWESGTRVFVKFYPPEPAIARASFDKFVDDTIKVIPESGWTTIP